MLKIFVGIAILLLCMAGGFLLINLLTVRAMRRAEEGVFDGMSLEEFLKKEKAKCVKVSQSSQSGNES